MLPAHHRLEAQPADKRYEGHPDEVQMSREEHDAVGAAGQPHVELHERVDEELGRLQHAHLVDEGPRAQRHAVRHRHIEALVREVDAQEQAPPGEGESDERDGDRGGGEQRRRREAPPPLHGCAVAERGSLSRRPLRARAQRGRR